MDRYRDRNDGGQRHRDEGENRTWDDGPHRHSGQERPYAADDYSARHRSSNFRDPGGQRWESVGGHRAGNRDWHRDRDLDRPSPYGVGADAAYGVPADDRYFARRYGSHIPQRPRDEPSYGRDWEHERQQTDQHPGYNEPVRGQTTEGGFFTPNLDGPSRDRLTGAELRRYQQAFDPAYVSWRDDQLSVHDRDYHAWREEKRRAYDDDYATWRRDRQEKFGKDFTDWRAQRTSAEAMPEPSADQRRATLSASRPGEIEKPKKHDS